MDEIIQRTNSPQSKYLVFVSAGDNSNLHHWLQGSRNFDLWITYYGEQGSRYKDIADFYNIRKGCKFPNFHYIYTKWEHIISHYDAILIMDDDIIINGPDISRMFEIRERYDLWVCQPAFHPKGKISHPITGVKLFNSLRYTNFVEVTCPLFKKDKLDAFMNIFDPAPLIEWGIDWWFLETLGASLGGHTAVIDAVSCINPLDSTKGGGQREIDKYANEATRIELWERFKTQHDIQSEKKGYIEYSSIKFISWGDLIRVLNIAMNVIGYQILRKTKKAMAQVMRSE